MKREGCEGRNNKKGEVLLEKTNCNYSLILKSISFFRNKKKIKTNT